VKFAGPREEIVRALGLVMLAAYAFLGSAGFAQGSSPAMTQCLGMMTSDHCACAAERLSQKHFGIYGQLIAATAADEDSSSASMSLMLAVGGKIGELTAFQDGLETVQMQCPGGMNYALIIADRSEAIRLNPQDANVFYKRGIAYHGQGDYARAIADYDAAVRLEPANPKVLNGRCWTRAVWGRELDLALADCNESLRLNGDNGDTLDSRGLVHLRRGEFEAALADYDAAVLAKSMSFGGHAGPLYGRGLARLRLGQTVEGRADIAAATVQDAKVAAEFARYGLAP
jgi:tetratricopeptide (TPR) repeat protein